MIHSMTGYASASAESPRGTLALELRSVNARFLDVQFRVAEELRALEPVLRELIAARVSRGKGRLPAVFANASGRECRPARRRLGRRCSRLKRSPTKRRKAFPEAPPCASPTF